MARAWWHTVRNWSRKRRRTTKKGNGVWSLGEHVCHVVNEFSGDSHRVFRGRVARTVAACLLARFCNACHCPPSFRTIHVCVSLCGAALWCVHAGACTWEIHCLGLSYFQLFSINSFFSRWPVVLNFALRPSPVMMIGVDVVKQHKRTHENVGKVQNIFTTSTRSTLDILTLSAHQKYRTHMQTNQSLHVRLHYHTIGSYCGTAQT